MLNPVHLRTLGVVLAAGSFADAARRLGYTPSAVSQQISTLERQLRITLFEREAHAIRPTAAALAVAERAVPALGALRAMDEDLRALAGGTIGTLRIGSFPTASERLLPAALSTLRRKRPRVEVELDEAEPQVSMQLLEAGEIDVALVYTYGTMTPRWARGHELAPVLEEDLLVISRPERPGSRDDVPPPLEGLEDFADATWIATREDTLGAAAMERLCRDSGFEPSIRYRSNNYGVLQGLVASGLGVALVPALGLDQPTTVVPRSLASPQARRRVSV
jgi:DNA-binding transcriptional LysR family regulator